VKKTSLSLSLTFSEPPLLWDGKSRDLKARLLWVLLLYPLFIFLFPVKKTRPDVLGEERRTSLSFPLIPPSFFDFVSPSKTPLRHALEFDATLLPFVYDPLLFPRYRRTLPLFLSFSSSAPFAFRWSGTKSRFSHPPTTFSSSPQNPLSVTCLGRRPVSPMTPFPSLSFTSRCKTDWGCYQFGLFFPSWWQPFPPPSSFFKRKPAGLPLIVPGKKTSDFSLQTSWRPLSPPLSLYCEIFDRDISPFCKPTDYSYSPFP